MSTIAGVALPTRNRLLSSCAVAAVAALSAYGQPAHAQLQGTPTVVGGSADITNPSAITGIAPRTIINWSDVPEVALPQETTQSFDGQSDYIVLNRLMPSTGVTNPAQLNGIVNSTINGEQQGGQVWFYSPNGIMVGANGQFNVGSLLLTANNLTDDNDFLSGQSNSFRFSRADSGAAVEVDGTISALGNSAYVALIAPRVRQSGSVTVNGSAAYVAAEDVSMTINGSLFDIQVNSGTGVAGDTAGDAAVVHDGSSTLVDNDSTEDGYGNLVSAGGPRHAIMVAVPKNDAITMLVSGNIDYVPAQFADVVENRIILSAGHNVTSGFIQDDSAAAGATATADIRIGNGLYESDVEGSATGTAVATASGDDNVESTDLRFDNSVDLTGALGASLRTENGGAAQVGGDLELTADPLTAAATPGAAEIVIDGGSVNILGSAYLDADAGGGFGSGSSVTGGTARVDVRNDGGLTVANRLELDVTGQGGSGQPGGNGAGGTIEVVAAGGSIVADSMSLIAEGYGGEAGYGDGVYGDGAGGSVTVTTTSTVIEGATVDGLIDVAGTLDIRAGGFGGNSNSCGQFCELALFAAAPVNTGTGGAGQGGTVDISLGSGSFDISELYVDVQGVGGEGDTDFGATGTDGSPGTGGTATITFGGGTNSIGFLSVNADGSGGQGANGGFAGEGELPEGGRGGDAVGGEIYLTATGSGSVQIDQANLSADAQGGDGGNGGFGGEVANAGDGGHASGGLIEMSILGGTASIGSLYLDVQAFAGSSFNFSEGGFGGDGGNGGDAVGGQILMEVANAQADFAYINGNAEAFGGEGGRGIYNNEGSGGRGGDGGDGTGGSITLTTGMGGSTEIDSVEFYADGQGGTAGSGGGAATGRMGGAGGAGGDALGGNILVQAQNGGEATLAGYFSARAFGGEGGFGGSASTGGSGGRGGNAQGGTAQLIVGQNSVLSTGGIEGGSLYLTVEGFGGEGGGGGYGSRSEDPLVQGVGGAGSDGGNGTGGTALLRVEGGSLASEGIEFSANGEGGDSGSGGFGEGRAAIPPNPDDPGDPGSPEIAGSYGASGNAGDGLGGTAAAEVIGFAAIDPETGEPITLGSLTIGRDLSLNAEGDGGDDACCESQIGGSAGDGTGGQARLDVDGGIVSVGDDTDLNVRATVASPTTPPAALARAGAPCWSRSTALGSPLSIRSISRPTGKAATRPGRPPASARAELRGWSSPIRE